MCMLHYCHCFCLTMWHWKLPRIHHGRAEKACSSPYYCYYEGSRQWRCVVGWLSSLGWWIDESSIMKRTKGQVFKWKGGVWGCISLWLESVRVTGVEGGRQGLSEGVDGGFKASGVWLNLRLCCVTPAVGRGWHEYQTAAACLIRPNSHARLQTLL